ncbi:MAG: PspC domain-containing protein [Candidatus Moranbacteria bacterium]|nr:PspC domain-containing protein [Candidatus Moranbacteria bacterium]
MKKTFSITLAGILFNIEEEGYVKLKDYLDSIREHFSEFEGSEILDDIEARAAEKFSEKIKPSKQAVTLADVEEFIGSMGTVEDITGEESSGSRTDSSGKSWKEKKLYRDPEGAMLFGVASGLANYFGIDPVLVRLAFLVSLFFGGAGIIIYIILCLIVPEAKTTSQIMEMKGRPVNLSNLKEAAEKKFGQAKKNISVSRPFGKIAKKVRPAIKRIGQFTAVILGVVLVIGMAAALLGISIVFANLLFNADSPFLAFSGKEYILSSEYYLAVTSVFFAVFIPIFFGMFVGISLIRRKWTLKLTAGLLLLFGWIISIAAVGVFAPRIAGRYQEKMQNRKNSETVRDFDIRVQGI